MVTTLARWSTHSAQTKLTWNTDSDGVKLFEKRESMKWKVLETPFDWSSLTTQIIIVVWQKWLYIFIDYN